METYGNNVAINEAKEEVQMCIPVGKRATQKQTLRASRNYKRSPFLLESSIISTLNIAHPRGSLWAAADLRFSFLYPISKPF